MAVHIESHFLFLCSFAFHNQTTQTDFHASVKQDNLVPLCFPSRTIYFWRIPSQARPSLWQPAQRGQDFRVVENVFFSVWQLEKLDLCLTLNTVNTESLKLLEACIVHKHIVIEEVSLRLRGVQVAGSVTCCMQVQLHLTHVASSWGSCLMQSERNLL